MSTPFASACGKGLSLLLAGVFAAAGLGPPPRQTRRPRPRSAGTWAEVQVCSELLPFPVFGRDPEHEHGDPAR